MLSIQLYGINSSTTSMLLGSGYSYFIKDLVSEIQSQNCVDDKFPSQLNSVLWLGFFFRFFSFSTDQKSFQGLILTDISDPENLISSSGLPFNQHICFICHKTTDYEQLSCITMIQYSSHSLAIVLAKFGKKNYKVPTYQN